MGSSSIVQDCVKEALTDVLGRSATEAVLYHLRLSGKLDDPEELHQRLYALFKEGADTLERAIVKQVAQACNLEFERGRQFDFLEYMDRVREHMSVMELKTG
jgi:hypothetical protein